MAGNSGHLELTAWFVPLGDSRAILLSASNLSSLQPDVAERRLELPTRGKIRPMLVSDAAYSLDSRMCRAEIYSQTDPRWESAAVSAEGLPHFGSRLEPGP